MKKFIISLFSIFLLLCLISCEKGKQNTSKKSNFDVALRAGGYGIEITNMSKDTIHNLKFKTGAFEAFVPLVRAESSVDISWSEFRDDENYPLSRIVKDKNGGIDRYLDLKCDEGSASWHIQY